MIIEVCVNSAVSAIEAQRGGADRVELCENLHDGGTTPSAGSIKLARARLSIGLYVMIRPRGGDFLYSDDEFEIMQHDIAVARDLGADGVVFGLLKEDGSVDSRRMAILAALARPMKITCHRAFDMTADPVIALEELISLGVDRVLTSGQRSSAPEGAELIAQLVRLAGDRITIMPGAGIKEQTVEELVRKTGVKEIHVHLDKLQKSMMKFRQSSVYMGKPELSEYECVITDQERVRKIREIAENVR